MGKPTYEELMELIKEYRDALTAISTGCTQSEDGDSGPEVTADMALELTPSSVREAIQVREELVAAKDKVLAEIEPLLSEYFDAPYAKPEMLPDDKFARLSLRARTAIALNPGALAETVRVREEWVKDVLHVLESHGLEGLFVSRRRCEELIEAYRRALAPIPPKSENGDRG
jgi:hypothetical protein